MKFLRPNHCQYISNACTYLHLHAALSPTIAFHPYFRVGDKLHTKDKMLSNIPFLKGDIFRQKARPSSKWKLWIVWLIFHPLTRMSIFISCRALHISHMWVNSCCIHAINTGAPVLHCQNCGVESTFITCPCKVEFFYEVNFPLHLCCFWTIFVS